MTVAKPKTIEAATALLERHAELGATIARVNAKRQRVIAKAGGIADQALLPLLQEQADIATAVEPWWAKASARLLNGKRKSIELGGCAIGTRTASESVAFEHGDDKAALKAVVGSEFKGAATNLVRVLDKIVIKELLRGKTKIGAGLKALGFKIAGGDEVFFIKRVDSAEAKVSTA